MRSYSASSYYGDKVLTTIAIEPLEISGDDSDLFYKIEVYEHAAGTPPSVRPRYEVQIPDGHIIFSSIESIEEFHRQLADFLIKEKLRGI